MEGYRATGQSEGAQLIGTYPGETFTDAVKAYIAEEVQDRGESSVDLHRFGEGRHAIWACELFDNEADARKSFG